VVDRANQIQKLHCNLGKKKGTEERKNAFCHLMTSANLTHTGGRGARRSCKDSNKIGVVKESLGAGYGLFSFTKKQKGPNDLASQKLRRTRGKRQPLEKEGIRMQCKGNSKGKTRKGVLIEKSLRYSQGSVVRGHKGRTPGTLRRQAIFQEYKQAFI